MVRGMDEKIRHIAIKRPPNPLLLKPAEPGPRWLVWSLRTLAYAIPLGFLQILLPIDIFAMFDRNAKYGARI